MTDTFSDCHPAVNVTFYMSAFMMGMCFVHPLFLICSFCLSMTYAALVKRHWIRDLTGMIGLFLILTILNPLFNTGGEKILFTLWNGRPYTWEALCYGAALSARFVTVLMWFATWNQVMTDDKLQYCIVRLAPSVALILTMVFRLVPEFQRKCGQISGARRCIGKSADTGSVREKVEHGLTIVSALTSWALEGGVVMADSMRSRGYGTGKRTAYEICRMSRRDRWLLCGMAGLIALILLCLWIGGADASYTPRMQVTGVDNLYTVVGLISYGLLLSIPTALYLMEELRWYILRSGI